MRTLRTIRTVSKTFDREAKELIQLLFVLSNVVVYITNSIAKLFILPFVVYNKHKQSSSKIVKSKKKTNVIQFADYYAKRKKSKSS